MSITVDDNDNWLFESSLELTSDDGETPAIYRRRVSMIRDDNSSDDSGTDLVPDPVATPRQKTMWKARHFNITLNEVTRWPALLDYLQGKNPEYLIAAQEDAPRTGHAHIHVYVYYRNQTKLFKGKLEGAHCEVCKGTAGQNIDYVKKDGRVITEIGECPRLDRVRQHKHITVSDALSMTEEQLQEVPVSSYHYVQEIRREKEEKEKLASHTIERKQVHWIYGPTGTGKTLRAWNAHATPVEFDGRFFTDWGDSKVVLFDDFRGEIPYKTMLKLTDQYKNKYICNIKGSWRVWDVDEIFITAPKSPAETYAKQNDKQDSISQLMRRLTECTYTGPGQQEHNIDMNNSDSDIDQ